MARQKLGQHFLGSKKVLEKIASAACEGGAPLCVEIGPGRGALTSHLLAHADRVIALELDVALVNVQFLGAVALGQVTPGPVVQTVAVVGYAAGGVPGGLLAAAVAFAPSFLFVIVGAPHFDRIRAQPSIQAFLTGAGPAAIGAIAGSAVPLGLALGQLWQVGVLALAAVWLLALDRSAVTALVGSAALGLGAVAAGLPVGR